MRNGVFLNYGLTQFGRAMNELNITSICANTSSPKGRVERAQPHATGVPGQGVAPAQYQYT